MPAETGDQVVWRVLGSPWPCSETLGSTKLLHRYLKTTTTTKTHKKTNKQKKPRESLFLDLGDQALRGKIEMSTALGSPSLEGRYMDSCLSSLMGEIWLSPSRLPSELSEEC